jgi:hypothetical protein
MRKEAAAGIWSEAERSTFSVSRGTPLKNTADVYVCLEIYGLFPCLSESL